MGFKKAGTMISKPKRVKRTEAHKRFGRIKVIQPKIEMNERKFPVCYSLPAWMIGWIEDEAGKAGMHRSTFVAALVGSTRDGMLAAQEAQDRADEMEDETEAQDEEV